jgi:phosphatidylinositol glycan class U
MTTIACVSRAVAVIVATTMMRRDSFVTRMLEFSSVTDSLRRTLEGAYLETVEKTSAYDGSAFHGHPGVLWAFKATLRGDGTESWMGVAGVAALDLVAVWFLRELARRFTRDESKVFRVCAVYALNPIGIMGVLVRSTSGVLRALLFASVVAALDGYDAACGAAFALAVQLNPHYVALLPAMGVMCASSASSNRGSKFGKLMRLASGFVGACAASAAMMGDDLGKWWKAAVEFSILSEDQTPNLGLHWYLFTTMFDHFRSFYVVALNVIPLALSIGASMRFVSRPLLSLTLSLMIATVCMPYPTLHDAATYGYLLSVIAADDKGNPLSYMKFGVLIAGGFLYAALLSPLTWYMWIHTRVANANFYYAITLVYACTQILLINQVAGSVLAFDRHRKLQKKE